MIVPIRTVLPGIAADPANPSAVPRDLPPAELARQLVDAPDLVSAVVATREALARGGVATTGVGNAAMRATAPPGSMSVTMPEVARLAMEARRRSEDGMVTAAELGQMLADFGWRFPAGWDPGQEVVALLGGWVSEARKVPSDPLNFTPLFLQALALRQDWGGPTWR